MGFYKGKLVELPKKGYAIVVSDIHGNLNDYTKYLFIWEKCNEKNVHFILTGDFIHALGEKKDESIKILESVKHNFEKYENFHALLGNHEWSTISSVSVYKGSVDQSLNFESHIKERFKENWKVKLEEYQNFFKTLPVAVKTDNKVFISHGGPPKNVKSLDEIVRIMDNVYIENTMLYQLLWNREKDFTNREIKEFLRAVGCNAMIVGHTPVNGIKLVGKEQVILSSSYTLGKKSYLILDLEKKIRDAEDLLKMEKKLHWYN